MRTPFLIFSLLLFFRATFASEIPAKNVPEKEFHDPFANETSTSKPEVKISDPLERVNRATFFLNDKLYVWILRPVSKGYRSIAPTPVRESFDRFFANIKYPVRGVNNLLEGRFKGVGIETARFVINSTVGIGGLFDPAAHWKLKPQPADFDQTFATYGLPAGMYLYWPVLGASSLRGTMGTAGDMALNPAFYLDWPWWVTTAATGMNTINDTSLHIEEYDGLKGATLDPYAAMRSAYFEKHR